MTTYYNDNFTSYLKLVSEVDGDGDVIEERRYPHTVDVFVGDVLQRMRVVAKTPNLVAIVVRKAIPDAEVCLSRLHAGMCRRTPARRLDKDVRQLAAVYLVYLSAVGRTNNKTWTWSDEIKTRAFAGAHVHVRIRIFLDQTNEIFRYKFDRFLINKDNTALFVL